jgi:hypothetical protein
LVLSRPGFDPDPTTHQYKGMKTKNHSGTRHDIRSIAGRIGHFYRFFNRQDWARCFEYIDPRLRADGKVLLDPYSQGMNAFYAAYGPVQRLQILRISVHDGQEAKVDKRDFAYVVISWKDKDNGFHHFRERWIKDGDKWFTRVLGLVPGRPESS